jgi:hypothetical protein
MKILALLFFIEAGYVPEAVLWNHTFATEALIEEHHQIYTDLGVELLLFDTFFLGGSVETSTHPSDGSPTFTPVRDTYTFGAGVRIGDFEAGWRHTCTHPVAANFHLTDAHLPEAAGDEVYLRYEAEIPVLGILESGTERD